MLRKSLARIASAALSAGVGAIFLTAPAQAEEAGGDAIQPSSPTTNSESHAVSQENESDVQAVWTDERMADAITLDKPANPAPRTDLDVEPQDTPEAEPETLSEPVAPLEDSVAPKAVYRSPAIGKVFFHNPDDGLDYVCSGSVINSPSKNVVSTAGHCVHNGDGGGWMEDWTFVPEYDKGNRPYGTWEWQTMTTFQGWTEDGSYDWDVAFVNMQQLNGSEIVNVTGGHGMIVNDSKEVDVTIFGYPAEDPFDGESQMYCEGTTYPRWFTSQIGFDCLMTGGSSGGPFLQDYSNDNLLGYLNGVISNGPPETSYSKYFDDDVSELFNGIKG